MICAICLDHGKFITVGYCKHTRKPYRLGEIQPNHPMPAIRCEVAIDTHGCTVYVDSFFKAKCGETLWDIVADSRVNHPKKRETI